MEEQARKRATRPPSQVTSIPVQVQSEIPSENPIDVRAPVQARAEARKKRRTANACVSCRQGKIKCSGDQPCSNCRRRSLECVFAEDEKKIVVSERYFQSLQRDAKRGREFFPESASKRSYGSAFLSPDEPQDNTNDNGSSPQALPSSPAAERDQFVALGESSWRTPFTQPSLIIKDTHETKRDWIWLAPSSTWSFTIRLTMMMSQRLNPTTTPSTPFILDGELYSSLSWNPPPAGANIDLGGIPPPDYAIYLFNTVKFHLCQNFRLFDEEAFAAHIHEFYHDAPSKVEKSKLWFVQFLLVLAFGKAFLSTTKNSAEPPGASFFVRALSLMPSMVLFWEEPILAIEVHALIGLYLYAIDKRGPACLYVAQAVKIAQMEGLHTELPEEQLGAPMVRRVQHLWWTIYIIDCYFSSSVGIPITVYDNDEVTTPLGSLRDSSQRDTALSLQVKLSHLLSTVISTVYKSEKVLGPSFLQQTKSTLNTIGGIARELEEIIDSKFKNSINTLSKGILHITLLYHRIVILATRPLLLSVLRERLERLDRPEKPQQKIPPLMESLVSTCTDSARKTLNILSALIESNQLETFLPFDLEFTYGAALALIMTHFLFLDIVPEESVLAQANSIFKEITSKGNMLARVRQQELQWLEGLFEDFKRREEFNVIERAAEDATAAGSSAVPDLEDAITSSSGPLADSHASSQDFAGSSDANMFGQGGFNFGGTVFNDNSLLGLSSDNMFSLADQIGLEDSYAYSDMQNNWI